MGEIRRLPTWKHDYGYRASDAYERWKKEQEERVKRAEVIDDLYLVALGVALGALLTLVVMRVT